MKIIGLLFCVTSLFSQEIDKKENMMGAKYAIVIHGGAGTILKENMNPELEKGYTAKLEEAILAGTEVLEAGGTSVEAVRRAIRVMEDSPYFNAGKGAVYTNKETHELDASIMNGKDKSAGAVGNVTIVKNPVDAAIAVMQKSEHVFLIGKGADDFAREQGVETVDPSYFADSIRLRQIQRLKGTDKFILDHDGQDSGGSLETPNDKDPDKKYGTVGAVALDKYGNIAAGTSTGGMANKKYGRVGDSPVIGAGTYADNSTCGISATGHGEFFIRLAVAKDISAMMEYGGYSLEEAARIVIQDKLVKIGGSGGVIGIDKNGNIVMEFNTPGMYRGYKKEGESIVTGIYKD